MSVVMVVVAVLVVVEVVVFAAVGVFFLMPVVMVVVMMAVLVVLEVVVVGLTLTHRYNAVRGHRTGSNNSGVEDYIRRKNKNRRSYSQ